MYTAVILVIFNRAQSTSSPRDVTQNSANQVTLTLWTKIHKQTHTHTNTYTQNKHTHTQTHTHKTNTHTHTHYTIRWPILMTWAELKVEQEYLWVYSLGVPYKSKNIKVIISIDK